MASSKRKAKTAAVHGVLPIDKVAFGASLAKQARLLDRMPNIGKPSIDQLEYAIHKAPETVEMLMSRRGEHMGPGEVMLLVVAADALGKGKPMVRPKSHFVVDPEVHAGDLHVKGSLTFSGDLFVLGDLVVDGVLREHHHKAHCLVAGSIRARGIKCGGTILSGKEIAAEVVFVELDGRIGATTELEAKLVILEDKESPVRGKMKATEKVVLAYPNTRPLERLRKLLAPAAIEVTDDGIFDYSGLMGAIERRRPWAAGKRAKAAKTPPARKEPKTAKPPAKKATAKKGPRPTVRRFVFVGGASKKFWEVRVEGPHVTTRYGRIGAEGQSKTKTFSGASIAEEEAAKLLHEKRRKGYTEVPVRGS